MRGIVGMALFFFPGSRDGVFLASGFFSKEVADMSEVLGFSVADDDLKPGELPPPHGREKCPLTPPGLYFFRTAITGDCSPRR